MMGTRLYPLLGRRPKRLIEGLFLYCAHAPVHTRKRIYERIPAKRTAATRSSIDNQKDSSLEGVFWPGVPSKTPPGPPPAIVGD